MQRFPYTRAAIYIYAGLMAMTAITARPISAQGFGAEKETVTLNTILPAVAHLPATDLKLEVNPAAPGSAEFAKSLFPEIQSMLQQSDSKLSVETDPKLTANARVLVECTITRFTPYNSKVVQQSPDRKIKGRTIPGEKDQTITAQLTIAYRAVDLKTRRPIDAEVIEEKYDQTFTQGKKKKSLKDQGKGLLSSLKKQIAGGEQDQSEGDELVPTAQQVYSELDKNISLKIASHLVNTNKKIQIKLAKGDLDKEAKIAEADDWQLMRKDLVSMGELPKPENEAYRQYDLGVSDEAMGYKASANPQNALPYFEAAVKEYKAAINDNRDEKYFLETQTRIEVALDNTQKRIDRMENGDKVSQADLKDTAVPGDSNESPEPTQAKAATKSSNADEDVVTNATIIDLTKSEVSAQNIIETIHDASKCDFNLSAKAIVELRNAKVTNEVITAMRQKTRESKGQSPAKTSVSRPGTHS